MRNTDKNMMRTFTAMILIAALLTINLAEAQAASPGVLDATFDADGKVTTNVAGDDNASDVAIQSDGKIVVVGRANLGGGGTAFDFFVVRYNPDGSLDTTFNTDGKVTTDFGNIDSASSVVIQADGKIVAVGTTSPVGGNSDFAIARYNANGSLDTTFDTDGKVTTDFTGTNDLARSVLIQGDNKIVVAGGTVLSGMDAAVARYNVTGSLDLTYSGDGKASFDVNGSTNEIQDMALQVDGKLVGVGANGTDFATYRLNANGTLDTTFDADGFVITNINGTDEANAVVIQADGKIIAAGSSDGTQTSSLTRYNTNGSLDTTFDGDGKVNNDLNPGVNDSIVDIKLQPDGKIIAGVGGTIAGPFNGLNAARYNSNGSLDFGFGFGGGVASTSTQAVENMGAIALANNKILLVGSGDDISIARVNASFQPTASSDFDGDGAADTTIFRPSSGTWFTLRSSDGTVTIEQFGLTGDIPIDGDFDGDSKADLCIFRPSSGVWFFKRSSNGTALGAQFGQAGDKPVVGDYDKDGKTDIAIFRPSTGENLILRSSSNFTTFFGYPFGQNGDINVMGGAQ